MEERIITTDDILGKEAVDSDGDILGVVMKIHIDKDKKELIGITIDQGFMKPDLYMGTEYIKNFGIDTIFLNEVPFNKYLGLEVLSFNGMHMGIVRDVLFNSSNKIDKLLINRSEGFSKKKYAIPVYQIKEIGAKVILKKGYKPEEEKE